MTSLVFRITRLNLGLYITPLWSFHTSAINVKAFSHLFLSYSIWLNKLENSNLVSHCQYYTSMLFSLYYSITMEKTSSSSANTSSLPFFVLIDALLLHTISNWLSSIQNLFSRFQSVFQCSQHNSANSKAYGEKNLDSELRHPQLCQKEDDDNLSREDVKMVMENLGIFCSPESEELPELFNSNELLGLFDEKEPSLDEVKQAFDVFDENRDGFIDARELQKVICILGLKEGSKLEDCQKMIRRYDENRDGRIEFNEFVKFMEASFC